MFKRRLVLLLLPASILCAEDLSQNRTWMSRGGSSSIEARVLEIDAEKQTVRMERADGLRFTAEWSRFGDEEQSKLRAATKNRINTSENDSTASDFKVTSAKGLPDRFELKDVPMVTQKGSYCVPASATMIAGYHKIETNQDEVAELSSEMSATNQGTYPSDMLLAMRKLGFNGRQMQWNGQKEFFTKALPSIREQLVETGPIYISFKAGVFGEMGHGCVIVGYNDRREEMYFYNPWGTEFTKKYASVAVEGRGLAFIDPPKPAPIATEAFIVRAQAAVPKFNGNFLMLSAQLSRASQTHELVWCSRRDSRDDKRFAQDTARDDGRKILELAFERNPAVLLPFSDHGITKKYYFVTRPPDGGARFLVRTIDVKGWSKPELFTLGKLTRNWLTSFDEKGSAQKIWELPMIELHPKQKL